MGFESIPDWLLQMLAAGAVVCAARVYVANRADLARLLEKAEQATKSAELAHSRIDKFLLKRSD